MSGGVVFEDECRKSLLKIVYSNSVESGERRIGDGVIRCVGSMGINNKTATNEFFMVFSLMVLISTVKPLYL